MWKFIINQGKSKELNFGQKKRKIKQGRYMPQICKKLKQGIKFKFYKLCCITNQANSWMVVSYKR